MYFLGALLQCRPATGPRSQRVEADGSVADSVDCCRGDALRSGTARDYLGVFDGSPEALLLFSSLSD